MDKLMKDMEKLKKKVKELNTLTQASKKSVSVIVGLLDECKRIEGI